jgi:hypothetical protein
MRAATIALAATLLLTQASCPEEEVKTLWLALGQSGFALVESEPHPY